jgi:hypothetical protein
MHKKILIIDNKYEDAIITDLILDDEEQKGGKIAGLQLHSRKMVRQTNAKLQATLLTHQISCNGLVSKRIAWANQLQSLIDLS